MSLAFTLDAGARVSRRSDVKHSSHRRQSAKINVAIMNSRLFRRRVGTTGMMQYDVGLKSDGIRDAVRQKIRIYGRWYVKVMNRLPNSDLSVTVATSLLICPVVRPYVPEPRYPAWSR
jgi:hypothetical protein